MGFPGKLIGAIRNLISNTATFVEGTRVETLIGCPQGSCLSPVAFCLYVNDLLILLNEITGGKAIAYADDVVIYCSDYGVLLNVIKKLEEWCKENRMQINKSKSGIF